MNSKYLKLYNQIKEDKVFFEPELIHGAAYPKRIKSSKYYEIGKPILFSTGMAKLIQMELHNAYCSADPFIYEPQLTGDCQVDGEIKRFIVAVFSYLDPRNRPKIKFNELLEGVLNKDYGSYLKKVRFISMVTWGGLQGEVLEADPKLEGIKAYRIDDISQIFNYRYWIFWSEDDPHDEYYSMAEHREELGLPPVLPYSDSTKRDYISALKSVLEEVDFEPVEPYEILMQATGSSSVGPDRSSIPHWENKLNFKSNGFTADPLVAKLVYVQKCPGDTRRASVLSVEHSNTIKLIEKQCSQIAGQLRDSAYISNKDGFEDKFHSFKRKYEYFLCRDMKKDGLTKPRELVMLTLQVLAETFPEWPHWYLGNVFSDWSFFYGEDPSKLIKTERGVGLGMTSALTTIIQCAVREMVTRRCWEEGELGVHGKHGALFYHDDSAIGFEDYDSLLTYDQVEDTVFSDLCLIKNRLKSFISTFFVLCERYSNRLNDKAGYELYLLNSPFYSTNIVQAKEIVQSLVKYQTQFDLCEWIPKYVQYWGYEFHEDEAFLPYLLGGWVPCKYNSVDTTFRYVEDDRRHMAAIMTMVHNLEKPVLLKVREKLKKIPYVSTLEEYYGPRLNLNGYEDYFSYHVPMSKMYIKMMNFIEVGSQAKAYALLQRKRKQTYDHYMNTSAPPFTRNEAYVWVQSKSHYVDYYPNPKLCLLKDIEDFRIYEGGPIVPQDRLPINSNLAFIAWHNPYHPKLQNIVPMPYPPLYPKQKNLSDLEKEIVKRIGPSMFKETNKVRFPKLDGTNYNFLSTPWFNPIRMAEAHMYFESEPKMPIFYNNRIREAVMEYRCSEYGYWINTTKYFRLFSYLVKKLTWRKVCSKIEYNDEFFTNLLTNWVINDTLPSGKLGDPYRTPLPSQTASELEELAVEPIDYIGAWLRGGSLITRNWESVNNSANNSEQGTPDTIYIEDLKADSLRSFRDYEDSNSERSIAYMSDREEQFSECDVSEDDLSDYYETVIIKTVNSEAEDSKESSDHG
jgi:hypothetical protein